MSCLWSAAARTGPLERRRAVVGDHTRGSAIPPSCCRRCTGSTWTGRPATSCNSLPDLQPNDDGGMQIIYGIDGRRGLTESALDDLSGYNGAHPVRIGNGAYDQRQNDVFGAVLDSILLHSRRSQRLPRRLWPIVQAQAACATKVWAEPGQGIWEARRKPSHYVSSTFDVLGRPRARRPPRRDARRSRAGGHLADNSGRHPRRHPRPRNQRTRRTTTPTDSTPPPRSSCSSDSSPTMTNAPTTPCSPSRRSSPRTASCRVTAPTRPTTGSLARSGPSSSGPTGRCQRCRWSASNNALATCRQAHAHRLVPRPVRREVRRRHGLPPRQLPASTFPPRPHRRRRAHPPRRAPPGSGAGATTRRRPPTGNVTGSRHLPSSDRTLRRPPFRVEQANVMQRTGHFSARRTPRRTPQVGR
jgi:hypothetical protein